MGIYHWTAGRQRFKYRKLLQMQTLNFNISGAADFLPDFVEASQKSGLPKYTGLPSIMKKLNAWLKQVKVIFFS